MSKWQPIATAPFNGKDVWVYGGRYKKPTIVGADGGFWRYETKHGNKSVPTHWTEIVAPEPPEKTP